MKRIVMLVALLSTFANAQNCPDDEVYTCYFGCTKEIVTPPFHCCMTPEDGYCCPAWCLEIKCTTGIFDCPLYPPEGIERAYGAMVGPGSVCHPVHGTCSDPD